MFFSDLPLEVEFQRKATHVYQFFNVFEKHMSLDILGKSIWSTEPESVRDVLDRVN